MMNRSKFLYELKNIRRNMAKAQMVIEELGVMSEDDTIWGCQEADDVIQIISMADEAINDVENVKNCVCEILADAKSEMEKAGYKRQYDTWGKWTKVEDGQEQL